jgi:trans-aconitate 2-methyltransferase
MARKPLLDTGEYYDLLAEGAREIDIWETEYLQALEGQDPVLEWVRGTGLRPILEGLAGEERDAFVERYRLRLRELYPRHADGRTLYPFRRLFLYARV